MEHLIALIRQAKANGEEITIAYGGGSRPGNARKLHVVSFSDTEMRAIEPGKRIPKLYKLYKILWIEDASGYRVVNKEGCLEEKNTLPIFETLDKYVTILKPEFEAAGWFVHEPGLHFGVGTYFKNGKPKKTPSIAISYFGTDGDDEFDTDQNENAESFYIGYSGERPWRVDSWRFAQGRTFKHLDSAMKCFVTEVRESNPNEAKSMFAGH